MAQCPPAYASGSYIEIQRDAMKTKLWVSFSFCYGDKLMLLLCNS